MPRFRLFKKPFSELSRHKQRDLYIRLRWKIQQSKNRYSKEFLSSEHLVKSLGKVIPLFLMQTYQKILLYFHTKPPFNPNSLPESDF